MLARGYVVVATDYPGLGTPGIHPYLIGKSEGRAVLDSVRAARDLPDAAASNRFAVWGHSQGGHASLYTGELAASYAPDLKLVGVAAAAPATYLIELFDADKSSSAGEELLPPWRFTPGRRSTTIRQPPWSTLPPCRVYEQLAHDCIESIAEFAAIEKAEKPLNQEQFLRADPPRSSRGRASCKGTHRARRRQAPRCFLPRAAPIPR
jgi:pimeloyl-ACP methyl ester carboxylesterase